MEKLPPAQAIIDCHLWGGNGGFSTSMWVTVSFAIDEGVQLLKEALFEPPQTLVCEISILHLRMKGPPLFNMDYWGHSESVKSVSYW